MGYACCIGAHWDCSGPSFYEEKTLLARKEHMCFECDEPIKPGERYTRISGIWEGSFSHYKLCESCKAVSDLLFCEGHSFGFLWEDISNYIDAITLAGDDAIPWSTIGLLPEKSRNRILDMIEEEWEDIDE